MIKALKLDYIIEIKTINIMNLHIKINKMSGLLFLIFLFVHTFCGSCPGQDLMVTEAFIDTFSYGFGPPLVQTTTDAGAILCYPATSLNALRLVKLGSGAEFEWIATDTVVQYANTFLRTSAEDSSNGFLYLAGDTNTGPSQGFISKYKTFNGQYMTSKLISKGTFSTNIYTILLDSSGILMLGGSFCTDATTCNIWLAAVSKSTLASTDKTLNTTMTDLKTINSIIEDGTFYVMAGTRDTSLSLWVGRYIRSNGWRDTESQCTTCTGQIKSMIKLDSTKYLILQGNNIHSVSATNLQITENVLNFAGAIQIINSPTTGIFIVTGYNSGNSYAIQVDLSKNCVFDLANKASHANAVFTYASATPYSNYFWVAGYFDTSLKAFAVKIWPTTPLVCASGEINYLNKNCYTILTTGCHPLCQTCLEANNPNSCVTVSGIADPQLVTFFAGRCLDAGKHYRVSTSQCEPIIQTSCHPTCGGDCFVANLQNECSHHCNGLDPGIDITDMLNNNCACIATYSFSLNTNRCVLASGCYPLCKFGECVDANDPSLCISCISGSNMQVTVNGVYTECVCKSNFVLQGTSCLACHGLCAECSLPASNTDCNDCSPYDTVVKTGTAAPYTCSCATDTFQHGSVCAYHADCHKLCNGQCVIKDDATTCLGCSGAAHVGSKSYAPLYECYCKDSTVYDASGMCVFNTECYALCNGRCSVKNDNTKCVACANIDNILVTDQAPMKQCDCTNGATLEGNLCIFSSGCYDLCNGKCTIIGDSKKCVNCATGTHIGKIANGPYFECKCIDGSKLIGGKCIFDTGCHSLCNGFCTEQNDNTKCLDCAGYPHIGKTAVGSTYECKCIDSTIYYGGYCVYNTGCYALCNGYCSTQNDFNSCLGCSSWPNIDQSGTAPIIRCTCAGTSFLQGKLCVFNSACHNLCDGICTTQNDNNKCIDCSQNPNIVKIGTGPIFKCSCSGGTAYNNGLCVYNFGCHQLCDTYCTELGDNTKCIDCINIPNLNIIPNGIIKTCSCKLPAILHNGKCVFNTGCHELCNGYCSEQADNSKCEDCANAKFITKTANGLFFKCLCDREGYPPNKACVFESGCHPLCNAGCRFPWSNTECIDCVSIPHIVKDWQYSDTYNCHCDELSTYIEPGHCFLNNGCHPLCGNGKCLNANDPRNCTECHQNATWEKISDGIYECKCPPNSQFNGKECVTILTENCHPLCGNGCIEPHNPTKCIGCIDLPNILIKTTPKVMGWTCSCAENTTLIQNKCVFTTGCSSYCKNCYSQNNQSACFECANNSVMLEMNGFYKTCVCLNQTMELINGKCQEIYTEKCHGLCDSKCISHFDNTKCLKCKKSDLVISTQSSDLFNCTCKNGTRYNDDGGSDCVPDLFCDPLCFNCTDKNKCSICKQKDGILLKNGQCICQAGKVYIDLGNGVTDCIEKEITEIENTRNAGYFYKKLLNLKKVE